jgi:hypothetical protein
MRHLTVEQAIASNARLTTMAIDLPRYLFVSAAEPLVAAEAVRRWADGPPDLCLTSPSDVARETAAKACAGHYVQTFDEPMLAGRKPFESTDDFAARYAEALRIVHVFDTRSALVVCDDVFGDQTPFVLDADGLLDHAGSIERALPLP